MKTTKLFIVVPCYNEEEVIEHSAKILLKKMEQLVAEEYIAESSRIIFVNDGSRDNTMKLLTEICHKDERCYVLNFLKNCGHQSAILAGMNYAAEYADAVITIDADLQQDINAMEDFIRAYDRGNDVVYGVRNDRNTDGFFKKVTALGFYKMMQLFGVDLMSNSADYRLLSKKAAMALSEYKESNLFLRGLIPSMGFQYDVVHFDVKDRDAGQSKYTLSKMMTLAIDGITSFSDRPIKMISGMGLIMCLLALIMIVISLVEFFSGKNVPGYTTEVVSIWLVGGMLMFSMGVVGEYVGKIYIETKKRPRYLIGSAITHEKKASPMLDKIVAEQTGEADKETDLKAES